MQWTENNLCRKESEQFFKQCWIENNFMQNPRNSLCRKQWTIFMRKQWIVLINAENKFYECSKQIWIDVQMYKYSGLVEKFDFVESKKSWKFI